MKPVLVIGISSGIAAFKILDLIKLLKKQGFDIYVMMTQHATEMFNKKEFEKVSDHKVYDTLFLGGFDYKKVLTDRQVEHIELSNKADIIVIAPATANIIGKIACGIADDFLTTTVLATSAPILLCPSMNTNMWNNQAVMGNIKKLRERGFYISPPESGRLACSEVGVGKLADVNSILKEIEKIVSLKKRLTGKKILVTAGGTVEPIDSVRVITNRSSGKMGVAIAEASHLQGADVLLLRAVSSVAARYPIREEKFETAKELENLMQKHIKDYVFVFHVAAVSDFTPKTPLIGKLDSNKPINLKLKPTIKICDRIKTWNSKIKLISFKAVYKKTKKEIISVGIEKLKQSKADYIIVNDVGKAGIGFAADDNEVYLISSEGLIAKIDKAPKTEIASKLLDYVL